MGCNLSNSLTPCQGRSRLCRSGLCNLALTHHTKAQFPAGPCTSVHSTQSASPRCTPLPWPPFQPKPPLRQALLLQAAILTGRRSKEATTLKEVDDSVDRIVAGMEGTPMVDSKSKSLVAYHEVIVYAGQLPAQWRRSCSSHASAQSECRSAAGFGDSM